MSKKIDIEKLIEKKYSDGNSSASLTLENLMSEISLALEQIAGSGAEQIYGSKLPGHLGESDYINVAKDNPMLSMGHGVERGSADGHSEGGNIDEPIIDNPLPEARQSGKFTSWADKKKEKAISVKKLELQLFVPILTQESLSSAQGTSTSPPNTPNTMSMFYKACKLAGVHSKKTMKEKLEALNTSIHSTAAASLPEMIASTWITRSIFNTFAALDADSYGKINEHIITSFYGATAQAGGGGTSGTGGIEDIIVPGPGGNRFIGLKTKVYHQKLSTSFLGIFKHVVLDEKEYEIFWFAKVTKDNEYLDFKFDARKIDSTNIQYLLPKDQQADMAKLVNFIKTSPNDPNVVNLIKAANQTSAKAVEDTKAQIKHIAGINSWPSLDKLNLTGVDTALEKIFSIIPAHPDEPGYEFTIDVKQHIENSNQNYKNIDAKIVEMYNSFSNFVEAYNKFIVPDVPSSGRTQINFNIADGNKATQAAQLLPEKVRSIVSEVTKSQQPKQVGNP